MLHEGSCHCGDIAFTVEADFTEGLDCNCSMCRRRGALLAFVPATAFELTSSKNVGTYSFNTHKLQHHFCTTCGIAPFTAGTAPDGTATRAINLRCVPDIELDSLKVVKWDGAAH